MSTGGLVFFPALPILAKVPVFCFFDKVIFFFGFKVFVSHREKTHSSLVVWLPILLAVVDQYFFALLYIFYGLQVHMRLPVFPMFTRIRVI